MSSNLLEIAGTA